MSGKRTRTPTAKGGQWAEELGKKRKGVSFSQDPSPTASGATSPTEQTAPRATTPPVQEPACENATSPTASAAGENATSPTASAAPVAKTASGTDQVNDILNFGEISQNDDLDAVNTQVYENAAAAAFISSPSVDVTRQVGGHKGKELAYESDTMEEDMEEDKDISDQKGSDEEEEEGSIEEESEDKSDDEDTQVYPKIATLTDMYPSLLKLNAIKCGPLGILSQMYTTYADPETFEPLNVKTLVQTRSLLGCVMLPKDKMADTSTLRLLAEQLLLAKTTQSGDQAHELANRWIRSLPTIKLIMNALFNDREGSTCLSGDGMGVFVRMDINENQITRMGVFVHNGDKNLVTVALPPDFLRQLETADVLVMKNMDATSRPQRMSRGAMIEFIQNAQPTEAAAGGSAGFDNLYNSVFNASATKMSDQELCKLSPEDMVKLSAEMQAKVIAVKKAATEKAAEEEMEDEYTDQEQAFLKLGAQQIMAKDPDTVPHNMSQEVRDILAQKVKKYWEQGKKTVSQMEWIQKNMARIRRSPFCDEDDIETARDYQKQFRDIQTANEEDLKKKAIAQSALAQGKPVMSGIARVRNTVVQYGFLSQASPQENANGGSRSNRGKSNAQPARYDPSKRSYGCSTCKRLLEDALNNAASASKAANAARKAGKNEEADTFERKATEFEDEAETLRQGQQSHKMKGPKCPRNGDASVVPMKRPRPVSDAAAGRAAKKLFQQTTVVMSASACNGAAGDKETQLAKELGLQKKVHMQMQLLHQKQLNEAQQRELKAKDEMIKAKDEMIKMFQKMQERDYRAARGTSPVAEPTTSTYPPGPPHGTGGHH